MTDRIVDAHVHLWDPAALRYRWLDGSALDRRIEHADLSAAAGPHVEFVIVQADCEPHQAEAEVQWLKSQAEQLPAVLGIVAFAPLESDDAGALIAALAATPGVVGIRRLLQDEPVDFLLANAFVDGVRRLGAAGLPFDACVRERQLAQLTELAARAPDTTFVLDHLGKPRVGDSSASWRRDIAALAALPNVFCKLSGLATEARGLEPTADLLRPYLAHALDAFGPDRCVFGSDWPVSGAAIGYEQWRAVVADVVAEHGPDASRLVFGDTARAVYRRR